jgi:hypothetical protein
VAGRAIGDTVERCSAHSNAEQVPGGTSINALATSLNQQLGDRSRR